MKWINCEDYLPKDPVSLSEVKYYLTITSSGTELLTYHGPDDNGKGIWKDRQNLIVSVTYWLLTPIEIESETTNHNSWIPASISPKIDKKYMCISKYTSPDAAPWYEFRVFRGYRKNKWGTYKNIEVLYWLEIPSPPLDIEDSKYLR